MYKIYVDLLNVMGNGNNIMKINKNYQYFNQ